MDFSNFDQNPYKNLRRSLDPPSDNSYNNSSRGRRLIQRPHSQQKYLIITSSQGDFPRSTINYRDLS